MQVPNIIKLLYLHPGKTSCKIALFPRTNSATITTIGQWRSRLASYRLHKRSTLFFFPFEVRYMGNTHTDNSPLIVREAETEIVFTGYLD